MSTLSKREMNILKRVWEGEGGYSSYWAPKVVKQLKVAGMVRVVSDRVELLSKGKEELGV